MTTFWNSSMAGFRPTSEIIGNLRKIENCYGHFYNVKFCVDWFILIYASYGIFLQIIWRMTIKVFNFSKVSNNLGIRSESSQCWNILQTEYYFNLILISFFIKFKVDKTFHYEGLDSVIYQAVSSYGIDITSQSFRSMTSVIALNFNSG